MSLLRGEELVCQEIVELVTDYLEGTLTRSQRRRFEAHLAPCLEAAASVSALRASSATEPPDAANSLAIARPRPVLAPVITATRPSIRTSIVSPFDPVGVSTFRV